MYINYSLRPLGEFKPHAASTQAPGAFCARPPLPGSPVALSSGGGETGRGPLQQSQQLANNSRLPVEEDIVIPTYARATGMRHTAAGHGPMEIRSAQASPPDQGHGLGCIHAHHMRI